MSACGCHTYDAAVDLQLAEINIATLVAPLDDPRIDDFRNALDEVNAIAERSPGFVWRLQTEEGNATAIQAFPDPLTIVNLSVWESPETLRSYVFDGLHRDFLRRRREFFVAAERTTALWWVRAGERPTVEDATARLAFLAAHGDSPYAFGLQKHHPVLSIQPSTLDDSDTVALIGELDAELSAMYPEPGSNHFTLTSEQVSPGRGAMLLARLDGRAVGCGAFRLLDATMAEVKRMYVRPEGRGGKLGAALLADLEHRARTAGAKRLVLETGELQAAALGLYAKAGFTPCASWGEYAGAPHSQCYDKSL
jgi:GNAT superfamily N-acetyltransferase